MVTNRASVLAGFAGAAVIVVVAAGGFVAGQRSVDPAEAVTERVTSPGDEVTVTERASAPPAPAPVTVTEQTTVTATETATETVTEVEVVEVPVEVPAEISPADQLAWNAYYVALDRFDVQLVEYQACLASDAEFVFCNRPVPPEPPA